jgi:hypothetical protein
MDPTKLVSHFSEFSVIFYTIYNNQQFTLTIEVYLLRKGPWKEWNACNVIPPAVGRRGVLDSGELAAGPCRGRAGGGLGVSYGSIQWAGRGGKAAGERRTGDPRWRPARLLLAGEGGSGNRTGVVRSTHACQRGCWRVQLGRNAGGAGHSPWRPLLAPAAMRLAAGSAGRRLK